jgi:hypothetical protein
MRSTLFRPTSGHKAITRLGMVITLALSLSVGEKGRAVPMPLVQNFSEPTLPTDVGSVAYSIWQGSSFTTGNQPDANIDSVTLLLREVTASNDLFVALYSDDTGAPNTLLATLINPIALSSVSAPNTFDLPGPLALTPDTTYWLVAGLASDNGGLYEWSFTKSFDQSGLPDWTIGNGFVFSFNDQGASWGGDPDGGPYLFSINQTVTTAPAPAPLPFLGAGAFWARSRKLRARLK